MSTDVFIEESGALVEDFIFFGFENQSSTFRWSAFFFFYNVRNVRWMGV